MAHMTILASVTAVHTDSSPKKIEFGKLAVQAVALIDRHFINDAEQFETLIALGTEPTIGRSAW